MVITLTDLLKAKAVYVWSSRCQQAFEDAKRLLTSTPVLAAPRVDLSFTLQVDASHVGAGVSFFSKKFNHYQLNYCHGKRGASTHMGTTTLRGVCWVGPCVLTRG